MRRRRVTITAKLLGYLLIAGVLPVIVLGSITFQVTKRVVTEQAELENTRLLSSFASYLNLYQDQIDDLAANIAGNSEIGQALRHADDGTADTYDDLELRARIGYILNSYVRAKGLVSINVFSRGGERFQVGETLNVSPVDGAEVQRLMRQADGANTPTLWRGVYDNLNARSDEKRVISVIRNIRHFSPATGHSDAVGVLVISLNNDIMNSFLRGIPLEAGSQLMSVDPQGHINLHSDPRQFGQPVIPALLALMRAPTAVSRLTLDGQEVLMQVMPTLGHQGMLTVIKPSRLLTHKVNQLATFTLVVVVLALLAVLTLAWAFARKVVAPVRAVSQGFGQIAKGPVGLQPLPVGAMPEEIAQLIQGYNNHLLALEAQNTAAEELRLAKNEAEAANLAKSRFLAIMSHEIRTPMNGILGMAQLLQSAHLSEQDRLDYARTVLSSGQSLLSLLNDILDLSKIEAGRFQMDLTDVDPPSLLSDSVALFAGAAKNKSLELTWAWQGPTGRRYRSDGHRLRQMLSNLLGNAIKFTATGHIEVQANEIALDGATALLEFSVTDTGMGIAPEKLALLFKPFSQTDSSTTRKFGGSGLGLSIVRSLAHLLGGEVGVQSEPGQGSRFWFTVKAEVLPPAAQPTEPEQLAHHQERQAVGTEANRGTVPIDSARVLVVEDNAVNRLVIESLLAQMALTVEVAHDGQQALARVQAGEKFDVILMDLQMPVMDGYASTTAIRDWELQHDRARTPIIALTADAFDEDRQHCMAVGMDGLLTKPIALGNLVSALQVYVQIQP